MIRIAVSLFFILCFTGKVYSQDVCYKEITGKIGRIEITGDTLKYIVETYWYIFNPHQIDTMAVCLFEQVDDEFIVLNSISNYDKVINGIRVVQSHKDSVAADSVRIRFIIKETDCEWCVSDNGIKINTHNNDSLYFSSNREFLLPKNFERFDFIIFTRIWPHRFMGLDFNLRFLQSPIYMLDKGCNDIEIHVPYRAFHNYSNSYYLKGEYVRIHNDTLYWKDVKFIKCGKISE